MPGRRTPEGRSRFARPARRRAQFRCRRCIKPRVAEAGMSGKFVNRLAFGCHRRVVRAGAGSRGTGRGFPLRPVRRFRRPRTGRGQFRCRSPAKASRQATGNVPAMPAGKPIAYAPATGAISRSRPPTIRAARPRATVFVRPAKPRWSTAAPSTTRRPTPASPIPNCRMRFAIAMKCRGLHLQRQGPDRSCPHQHRERPHAAQGPTSWPAPAGLMVAGRGADKRGASLNFSPVPDRLRSHYQRVPVVAAGVG